MSEKLTLEDIGEAMKEAKRPSEHIQATPDGKLYACRPGADLIQDLSDALYDACGVHLCDEKNLRDIAKYLTKLGWHK